MNLKFCFIIGIVFFVSCCHHCGGETVATQVIQSLSTEFTNLLVTPTPVKEAIQIPKPQTECPNLPVTPIPVAEPAQTVKPQTECPNLPVTPVPVENPNQTLKPSTECPNFPVTPIPVAEPKQTLTSTECPNLPVTPIPVAEPNQTLKSSTECPNLPVTPAPIEEPAQIIKPSKDCPNSPIAPNTTETPASTISPQSNCANQTIVCCSACCCQNCCHSATTPPPLVRPETIIQCPPGTQLLGKRCHLLYCPRGSQMINDRCVVIECPLGTVWTGHRCSLPEPIIQNVSFHKTIVTHISQTKPNIVLNNTNNIVVDASVTLRDVGSNSRHPNDCNNDQEECDETDVSSVETTPEVRLKCCEVFTPRICEQRNNRWRCYSRRYRRCGEFCIAPTIYLKPSKVRVRPHYLVMPPIQEECHSNGNCVTIRGGYDCSGCGLKDMERCSYYCYRYACPPARCEFYDQTKYCANNAGSHGCQEEDGCFGNWCL